MNGDSPQPLDRANLDFHFKGAADAAEKKVAEKKRAARLAASASSSTPTSPDPAQFADDVLAREFSTLHAADLKYTAAESQWYVWTGIYWKPDTTLAIWQQVREFVEAKAAQVLIDFPNFNGSAEAANLRSKPKIYAIEALARSDERHATNASQWNPNPMILATPAGVVDLQTGQLRPARSDDLATQLTLVGPAIERAEHPIWTKFLEEVTKKDVEMQRYIQRAAGYILTGEIREHVLFFAFGPGGNGKGTFVDTLYEIMGDYATGIPISALMASKRDRHSTDIYRLKGHRLAITSETESGREWDESRIKQLTGGDPITARRMLQDNVTFMPTHKLLISGNNQPKLKVVDDAARRRFHMMPFTLKIEHPDKLLREKLRREYPAILRWALDGALAWQRQGLNAPSSVLASTADYFENQDLIGKWLADREELVPNAETLNKDLYNSLLAWSAVNGDQAPDKDVFLTYLRRLSGVQSAPRRKTGRGLGIRLRPQEPGRDELLLIIT